MFMATGPSTQSSDFPPAQKPARYSAIRTILALMMREMSTTYGKSSLGYLWALIEPVAGILLLTLIFSLALRSPSLGTNFALFYASGMLPFILYLTVSQKISVALKFSRALMFYPRVTYMDTLVARALVNVITQILVSVIVISAIIILYDVDFLMNSAALIHGYVMGICLAFGVGTLNCYLLSVYPTWENVWAVLNRPLFFISGVFFTPESISQPYRDWMLWNPIAHIIGEVRRGIYPTYDAVYIDRFYVYSIALTCSCSGILLLRRYHKDISSNR